MYMYNCIIYIHIHIYICIYNVCIVGLLFLFISRHTCMLQHTYIHTYIEKIKKKRPGVFFVPRSRERAIGRSGNMHILSLSLSLSLSLKAHNYIIRM